VSATQPPTSNKVKIVSADPEPSTILSQVLKEQSHNNAGDSRFTEASQTFSQMVLHGPDHHSVTIPSPTPTAFSQFIVPQQRQELLLPVAAQAHQNYSLTQAEPI